ncbi:MAG TPA: hypothetical protein VFP15_01150, partial [Gemmatimonadaceae bacterium]|nr:hypothetical protein [Gemmatimonadaceae bacterium]
GKLVMSRSRRGGRADPVEKSAVLIFQQKSNSVKSEFSIEERGERKGPEETENAGVLSSFGMPPCAA